jgi:hypothetical protein
LRIDPVSVGTAGTTTNLEIISKPSSNSLSLIAAESHHSKQSTSVSDEKQGPSDDDLIGESVGIAAGGGSLRRAGGFAQILAVNPASELLFQASFDLAPTTGTSLFASQVANPVANQ